MKKRILSVLFFIFSFQSFAQHIDRCPPSMGKDPRLHELLNSKIEEKKNARKSANEGVVRIPVVVHVIHNNANGALGGTNISDAQILSQIEVLNEDYRRKIGTPGYNNHPDGADMEIEFFLAPIDPEGRETNGINRVYSAKRSFSVLSDAYNLSDLAYWDSNRYLNIWVANLSGGYLGFAEFPFGNFEGLELQEVDEKIDGVIIDYRAFGRKMGAVEEPYNYGRTATHEIGHWLGLIHIWGDEYCGTDFCDDTPPAESANRTLTCNDILSNCRVRNSRNMIENFLDYTVDSCMNVFTNDQKARVRAILGISERRKQLVANADLFFEVQEPIVVKVLGNPVVGGHLECKIQVNQARDYSVEIVDPLGRKVYSKNFTSAFGQILKIPKKELGQGVRHLKVISGNLQFNYRLLVL